MASAGKPTDAQWQVRGNNAEGHSDIANTQLLYVVEHGEDILSFKSFDNDFLSVEKDGSHFKLVVAPWIFDDPKENAQSCHRHNGRGVDKPIKDKIKFRMVPRKRIMLWLDSVYEEPQALQSIEYPKLWLRMADGGVPKRMCHFGCTSDSQSPRKK